MVIPEVKSIFVHIPKTGGTSIEECLWYDILKLDRQYKRHKFLVSKYFPENHAHVPLWKHPQRNEFYTFTFVRNPYARLISHYLYRDKYEAPYRSFEHLMGKLRKIYKDTQKRGDLHLYTQTSYLQGDLNYIGRFENLDKDFRKICRQIGVSSRGLTRHVFPTDKEKKKEILENVKNNLKEITRIYWSDFENFNYEPFNLENVLEL